MSKVSNKDTLSIQLSAAEQGLNRIRAEYSLEEYYKQSWRWMEGGLEYKGNWHIGALADHLEAVVNRQIKNLLINMPPRFGKSNMISVGFPSWVWGPRGKPEERLVYASYALSLARRDSGKCRRLIASKWYQENWGHRFSILRTQDAKERFDNDKQGYRIITSSGSGVTGEGGTILICDDPNASQDGRSTAERQTKIDWWSQTWSSRLNDRKNDCRIVVQQRIHPEDITGHVLYNDESKEWTTLILPMEFKEARRSYHILNGKEWTDPRTKEGELLWPEKLGEKEIAVIKQDLGSYDYACQYQQSPAPEEGGIIKKAWFQWWKDATPPVIDFVVQSWDTAMTAESVDKKRNDVSYSACTTWGVFLGEHDLENIILLSMWRGRVEYPDLRRMAQRLYFDYRDTGEEHNPKFTGRPLDMCLVEAKASGVPLIQDLHRAGIRAVPFDLKRGKYGDKFGRVRYITHLIEAGVVWLPARPPSFTALLPFAEDFLQAISYFGPSASSGAELGTRDLVDSMTQVLIKLKDGNFLVHPKDERPIQLSQREVKDY